MKLTEVKIAVLELKRLRQFMVDKYPESTKRREVCDSITIVCDFMKATLIDDIGNQKNEIF